MRLSFFALLLTASGLLHAASCEIVAEQLNRQLRPTVNAVELAQVLSNLNQTGDLPAKFVTKKEAAAAGWRPGSDLHRVLPGKSIGGDHFGNYEKRLPAGRYKEADLDYRGGKRGAKRIVFSRESRFVTVDHYRTFQEVPPCQ